MLYCKNTRQLNEQLITNGLNARCRTALFTLSCLFHTPITRCIETSQHFIHTPFYTPNNCLRAKNAIFNYSRRYFCINTITNNIAVRQLDNKPEIQSSVVKMLMTAHDFTMFIKLMATTNNYNTI